MILNDKKIKHLLEQGLMKLDPYQSESLSPASYDLAIGGFQSINMKDQHPNDCLQREGEVEILPGESFLASTIEIIGLPNTVTGTVANKSSTGRRGLFLASPGWIDPGFIGQLTIAMKNESMKPLVIKYGQKLWQIVFAECEPAEQSYTGHYQNSEGIVLDKTDQEVSEELANKLG